jgi:hypothetical protein
MVVLCQIYCDTFTNSSHQERKIMAEKQWQTAVSGDYSNSLEGAVASLEAHLKNNEFTVSEGLFNAATNNNFAYNIVAAVSRVNGFVVDAPKLGSALQQALKDDAINELTFAVREMIINKTQQYPNRKKLEAACNTWIDGRMQEKHQTTSLLPGC